MATERIETLISKEALDQFAKLKDLNDANVSSFEKLIAKTVELNKQLGGAKTFKQVVDGTKELEKAEADLVKQKSELEKQQAKLNQLYTDEAKKLAELKIQQQQRSAQIKNTIKEEQAAKGSIEQRRQALTRLQKEYDNLSAKERESSRGQRLETTVAGITNQLKQLEGATGRFQRNVGNYSGSAKIIVDALEKARQKFEGLKKAADSTPAALERAKSEFESLRNITDNKQFLNFSGKMGDATQEVRTFTRTLVNLETQGLGNTEVANDLRRRLAELTDQIADTRSEVKALASDTRTFDLFASSVSFAADVFQTAAGAAVAFGASEQDAAEATKTLLAIQNISMGVQGIANELTTKGTAANKAYAFAQQQLATAFDTSAKASARFKAALISLGIGAIIVGIGLLIANFSKLKNAFSGLNKEQLLAKEISDKAVEGFVKEKVAVEELVAEGQRENTSKRRKLEIIQELNEKSRVYFGHIKTEKQLQDEGTAAVIRYVKAIELKARAQAATEILGEKEKAVVQRQIELERQYQVAQTARFDTEERRQRTLAGLRNLITTGTDRELQALRKESEPVRKVIADLKKELDEIGGDPDKKNETKVQSVNKKFYDAALKAEADQFKKLSEVEEGYYITRLSAREKAYELEKQILVGQRNADIVNAQGDSEKLLEIQKDYADKKAVLTLQFETDNFSIIQSFRARQLQLDEEANQLFLEEQEKSQVDLLDIEDKNFQKRQHFLEENRDILLKSLQEERNAKVAAAQSDAERIEIEQEYANKRNQIELQANLDILNAAIDVAQKKLQLAKDPELVAALEAQLADLRKQLSELKGATIDFNIDTAQQKVDKLVAKIQGVSEKLLTGFQAVGDIINLSAERDLAKIEEEMAALEKRSAREIELTNAEAISKEEKEKKIAIIEARTQAQREALERRQRTIELQRARFEKAVTIGRIIADTAAAVVAALGMKPYTPANIALAAVTGAIGAVQLAKAIATPLPKFATGTDDAPGGLAVVGDGGRSELVVTPQGELMQTPAVPTVMNVPKHSIIFPNAEQTIAAMKASIAMNHGTPKLVDHGRYYKEMTAELKNEMRLTRKAIVNKKEIHIHRSKEGWDIMTKSGGNQNDYFNRNLRM